MDEGIGCCCTHKENEKKLRPLFTSGIGKKKEEGKHMWSTSEEPIWDLAI
jgi:hypothetical protein